VGHLVVPEPGFPQIPEVEARMRSTSAIRVKIRGRQGRRPDSPLLALEHAALVRCYAALLAAVHH
jgi:hypothetical protein